MEKRLKIDRFMSLHTKISGSQDGNERRYNIKSSKKLYDLKRGVSGFTLVELLVVIAIIGIIGLMAMVTFNESRARARDSRRVSDIQTLHNALAMYNSQHSQYAVPSGSQTMPSLPGLIINGGASDWLTPDLKADNIMGSNLIDPRDGQTISGEIFHYYYFTDAEGKGYTVTYCLETNSVISKSAGCGNAESF